MIQSTIALKKGFGWLVINQAACGLMHFDSMSYIVLAFKKSTLTLSLL
jgi:hypothetical protein